MNEFDPEYLKAVAAECPGFQARATARAVTRYYNACFKPFGLTAEQFSLLVGVGAAEGATLVELAVSAGVDVTTLSRNVQNLEVRGLIHADGGRGRAGKRLRLTVSGRALLMDAFPAWKSAKAELAKNMGQERLASTIRVLAELAEAAALSLDDAHPESDS